MAPVNSKYAFHYYENSDQSGVVSPVDDTTIMSIPYNNNWYGQRYLLSTFSNNSYTPLKLQNIKELSFTIDLSNVNNTNNCNFNCYFVSSSSLNNPNKNYPPINNLEYVPTANYYDAAAADGGRYGVEFDVFETNSGNGINFFQNTGHFNSDLLDGTATNTGAQCITYSSATDFNTEPENQGEGAPNTNYRTKFEGDKTIDVLVKFSATNALEETTISFNGKIVWNSKWLIGGTWNDWKTASPSGSYPCSTIGTLTPFSNVTTETAIPNDKLTLETINNANKEGMWLFIGMNPYYAPSIGKYDGNHKGTNSPNGSGGGIEIKNFDLGI